VSQKFVVLWGEHKGEIVVKEPGAYSQDKTRYYVVRKQDGSGMSIHLPASYLAPYKEPKPVKPAVE
jgi:hypothetical protein